MAIYQNKNATINKKNKSQNYKLGITLVSIFSVMLILLISNIMPFFNRAILGVFGLSIYAINLILIIYGILLICNKNIAVSKLIILYAVLAFACLVSILHIATSSSAFGSFGEYISYCYTNKLTAGGVIFGVLVFPVNYLFNVVGSYIFYLICIVALITISIDNLYLNNTRVIQKEKNNKVDKSADETNKNDYKSFDDDIFINDESVEDKEESKPLEFPDDNKDKVKKLLGLKKEEDGFVAEDEVLTKKQKASRLFKDYSLNDNNEELEPADNSKRPAKIIHAEDEIDTNPTPMPLNFKGNSKQLSEKERKNLDFIRASRGEEVKPAPVEQPQNPYDYSNDLSNNKQNFDYDPYSQNDKFEEADNGMFNPYGRPNRYGDDNNYHQNNSAYNNEFGMNNNFSNSNINGQNNMFNNGLNNNYQQPSEFNNNYNSFGQNKNVNQNEYNNDFDYKFGFDNNQNEIQKMPIKNDNQNKSQLNKDLYADYTNKNLETFSGYNNNNNMQAFDKFNNNKADIYDKDLTLDDYKKSKVEYIEDYDKVNRNFQNIGPQRSKDYYDGTENEDRVEAKKPLDLTRPHEQMKIPEFDESRKKKQTYKKPPKYTKPPIDLLNVVKNDSSSNQEDYTAKADMLEQTLNNFKIPAKVCSIMRGPAFTRFEMQMPTGISVKKITNYINDIAMSLESHGEIRIEIPIPGKNAFGVEVPNEKIDMVGLRDILESNAFQTSKSLLTFGLGKDITGDCKVTRLDKMPHLLIAGATGSGKSVCLNSLIISILYKAGPEDVKFILIDPKTVEFTPYNGLPHMLVPGVITQPDKAVASLEWAINEMERRYNLFSNARVRNMEGYNEMPDVVNGLVPKLPFIVIIVDELADLMTMHKKEVEEKIMRLAQKSRAAGLHLVLATQRPSVDVITGTIKANLPSRIAFAVTAFADSKTILDQGGADKLLGKGDMLYSPLDSPDLTRIQGAFVSDPEVEKIVNFIKENNEADFDEEIEDAMFNKKNNGFSSSDSSSDDSFDPLMKDALRYVIKAQSISISRVQRVLGIGYPRAGKIVDQMEKYGFISSPDNKNNRQIFITQQEFEERFGEDLE